MWYLSEDRYFEAACSFVSALPGAGDFIGAFAKSANKCKIVNAFHKAGAYGNIALNMYEMGNIAKKYISGGEHSWKEIARDAVNVALRGASALGSTRNLDTSYCFVAGTLVTTEDGFKQIEEIEVGDKVLSEDEVTGEVETKTVTKTYINQTTKLTHIGVNGEEFVSTPTHPFYVHQRGWTQAANLRAGDVLVLSNGELITVEWVQHEILESPIKVYNFEVQDFHTYFVGENSVLVYNMCGSAKSNKVDSEDNVTVGRWMNEDEYNKMISTDKVQPSLDPIYKNKHKDVAYPSDSSAFGKQAPKGSVYVEFDVPFDRVKSKGSGWARVLEPDSYESRLKEKRGEGGLENFTNTPNIRKRGLK